MKGLGPERNHEGDQRIKEESSEKYQGKNKNSKDDQIRLIKFNARPDLLWLFLEWLLLKISRNIFSPDSAVINILCNKKSSSIPTLREKTGFFSRRF